MTPETLMTANNINNAINYLNQVRVALENLTAMTAEERKLITSPAAQLVTALQQRLDAL